MTEPRFRHDCEDCVFIGHYEGHDIYRCPQEGLPWPTIVARYGDDGPEYTSGKQVTVGDLTLRLAAQWERQLASVAVMRESARRHGFDV